MHVIDMPRPHSARYSDLRTTCRLRKSEIRLNFGHSMARFVLSRFSVSHVRCVRPLAMLWLIAGRMRMPRKQKSHARDEVIACRGWYTKRRDLPSESIIDRLDFTVPDRGHLSSRIFRPACVVVDGRFHRG